jgi:hypothetical protein
LQDLADELGWNVEELFDKELHLTLQPKSTCMSSLQPQLMLADAVSSDDDSDNHSCDDYGDDDHHDTDDEYGKKTARGLQTMINIVKCAVTNLNATMNLLIST